MFSLFHCSLLRLIICLICKQENKDSFQLWTLHGVRQCLALRSSDLTPYRAGWKPAGGVGVPHWASQIQMDGESVCSPESARTEGGGKGVGGNVCKKKELIH